MHCGIMLPVKNSCYKEPELEVAVWVSTLVGGSGLEPALILGGFEGTGLPSQSGQSGRAGYVL